MAATTKTTCPALQCFAQGTRAAHSAAATHVEVTELAEDAAEIVATPVSTAVEPAALNAVAERIGAESGVIHDGWTAIADDRSKDRSTCGSDGTTLL